MKIKMTKDLLENVDQIKKDAKALYKLGERYDGLGVTDRFIKYLDEHYEYEMEDSGSIWGGLVMTDEQFEIYDKYTDMVRLEIRKIQLHKIVE